MADRPGTTRLPPAPATGLWSAAGLAAAPIGNRLHTDRPAHQRHLLPDGSTCGPLQRTPPGLHRSSEDIR